VIYPVKISMEQCSSEITASYKASLVSGNLLVDLTGGFGVDSAAFSKKFSKVLYVERDKELAEIAAYNFGILRKDSIEVFNTDSEKFISEYKGRVDCIYIDPARRKEGNKVFRFVDCTPDVIKLRDELFARTDQIMIKTSPLLDIDLAVKELGFVHEVHVLAVENECKELLFILDRNFKEQEPKIIAVNIRKGNDKEEFRFTRKEEDELEIMFEMPGKFIYEPNSAMLKAGAFKSTAKYLGVEKLNKSSHLYTSETYKENFPGRSFQLLKIIKYSHKDVLAALPEGKANITVRNFPDSVEEIRKKTGLKDGGSHYLFATKDKNDKPLLLLTQKVP